MIELFSDNFSQIIGFAALILGVSGYQFNFRNKILLFQGSANFLWAIHFYLIGAFTGSAVNLVAVARNYTFVKYRLKFRWPILPVVFIAIFTAAIIFTWQGYLSLLPLGGMICGTIAFWHKNPTFIRFLSLACSPMWFVYNFISGSYPGVIIEVFIFCSILIAILRYDILRQRAPQSSVNKRTG
jgi:hypothetical protein